MTGHPISLSIGQGGGVLSRAGTGAGGRANWSASRTATSRPARAGARAARSTRVNRMGRGPGSKRSCRLLIGSGRIGSVRVHSGHPRGHQPFGIDVGWGWGPPNSGGSGGWLYGSASSTGSRWPMVSCAGPSPSLLHPHKPIYNSIILNKHIPPPLRRSC
jgi:hypothetical protein